ILFFRSAVFFSHDRCKYNLRILHHCEILAGLKSGGNASAQFHALICDLSAFFIFTDHCSKMQNKCRKTRL
ncbi:hypothetical protein, partial [Acinetobacter baumannii]|uniref:hypothetical protein n=1 Tax=Acinetobacter baumannii TaxID=470 RepID=UPI001230CAE9